MKTKFRINVTFFQHLILHRKDKDMESKRIHKKLVEEYQQFRKIIEKSITKKKFGPLKGINVSVGDDDDLYPHSTQVEYWFGFDYTCAPGEDGILEDDDGEGVLQLNEEVKQRIKAKIERVLNAHYCPDLTVSAVELHAFKTPNVVIHKPIDFDNLSF